MATVAAARSILRSTTTIQMLTSRDCHRRDKKIRVFMAWRIFGAVDLNQIAAMVYDNLAIRSCEAFAGGVDRMC
ncbi:hypothetical protein AKJ16_DCAP20020 [Drosera capensis]